MTRKFVDGVLNVFVLGGAVRIEFFELVPEGRTETGNDRSDMKPVQTLTIAIPTEGFLKAVDALNKVRSDLHSASTSDTRQLPSSPNFKRDN